MKPMLLFKAGTRPSPLALTQTRAALDRIEEQLTGVSFEMEIIASVGDTDRTTDLRESPADFFTRELDAALLRGTVDLAVHSAKDLPDPMSEAIDWFWLPWRAEPRDVLLLAKGRSISDLPANPIVGVSSDRREAYCTQRFPTALQKNIRGNIEERIEQVDHGTYDIVIIAAAALVRLGLEERITEWIELEDLDVPEAQGYLALTFRKGDPRMMALRSLFTHAVTFAGAGVSHKELCTVATLNALQQCDVCLHDSLIDPALLDELPPHAQAIDVGKRCGSHSKEQHETTKLICECARQGKRVVRLKGGDPGLFGRLAEETEALDALAIPYRVIPGISALQAATTGTGMLLTRRDVSRGFVALTPRMSGGALARCDASMKNKLPAIYFMSIKAIEPISRQLLEEGYASETPAALIFNAGGEDEQIIKTTLGGLMAQTIQHPGLILVGNITAYAYKTDLGALRGQKVLLTCSESLQEKAVNLVRDWGGRPIQRPLIRLTCRRDDLPPFAAFDWLVVTSPSSVRVLMQQIKDQNIDLRTLPKIMVCGRGTADEFLKFGLHVDAQPDSDFSATSLIEQAKKSLAPTDKILRIRSDKAGTPLAEALRQTHAAVEDFILYDNEAIPYDALPVFDSVFFASASAVKSFIQQWGSVSLAGKTICVIGKPTADALEKQNLQPTVTAREATVFGALQALAEYGVSQTLYSVSTRAQHAGSETPSPGE